MSSELAKSLDHYVQPKPYGCIYYSYASLMQDPYWIEQEFRWECTYERFVGRVFERGQHIYPIYINRLEPCKRPTWRNLIDSFPWSYSRSNPDSALLHVHIDSDTHDGMHVIGVRIVNAGTAIIHNPCRREPEVMKLAEFYRHEYSEAYSVWQCLGTDYRSFDPQYGDEIIGD